MEKVVQKNMESPHSVKVNMNTKGLWSGEVKCYGTSPEEAMTETMKLMKTLELVIKQKNSI